MHNYNHDIEKTKGYLIGSRGNTKTVALPENNCQLIEGEMAYDVSKNHLMYGTENGVYTLGEIKWVETVKDLKPSIGYGLYGVKETHKIYVYNNESSNFVLLKINCGGFMVDASI